jgi:1,4-alpha-glucan branching enzyme
MPRVTTLKRPAATESLLSDYDLYLFNEGTHTRAYQKLGAHPRSVGGRPATYFATWAPNADAVSVMGDFNAWDPAATPLQSRGSSGVWETNVPEIGPGSTYKFSIRPRGRLDRLEKADPFAFAAELRPRSASIVWDLFGYAWGDAQWLAERQARQALDAPISIYEVHLGSWKRVPETGDFLGYRDLAAQLAEYCTNMGYTHVELMPISEHPLDKSWGYQTIGYYAPTSRFGTPDDFRAFVDTLHQAGIGVLVDWVPSHFPRDPHGLAYYDGSALFEHADPRQGQHPEWGTQVFNYGRHEVRSFLLSNALFWLDEYHIDGLRVDAVASMLYLDYGRHDGDWIPNQFGGRENLEAVDFLRHANELVHSECPGVLTIAEESTAWPMVSRPPYMGGLGFSLKWNMGWMNDTLRYLSKEPVHRRWHHHDMTFSLLYAFHENFVLPLSHDEVVHGKGSLLQRVPGDAWQQFATLRALFGYMWGHPGKKLLFMGDDFGHGDEWWEEKSLDWHLLQYPYQAGVQRWVADLNRLYRDEPALHEVDFDWPGFEWIEVQDSDNSVFAFMRRAHNPADCVVVVSNFTPVARYDYCLGVPVGGEWRELLNSDAEAYGGGNLGNGGALWASDQSWAYRPYSLHMLIPPLGTVFLKPAQAV